MANEASIQGSLQVIKGNLKHVTNPTQYQATVAEGTGPTPGTITVSTSGTDVDLSQVTTPGLCYIQNLDPTNYVEYGPYNPGDVEFSPLCELLPGEFHVIRLSRYLGIEWGSGPGTGTVGSGVRLRIKAIGSACRVKVEVFGK